MKYLLSLLTLLVSVWFLSQGVPHFVSAPVYASEHEQQYTCGMHPMIVVDEPGICPVCQMDLTPLKAGGDSSTGSQVIKIDAATSQKMGIRTAAAEARDLIRNIHTVGIVAYEEPGQHAISSKIDGWVEQLSVNETGQQVTKGQPLLTIYSPDLVAAQEELLLAVKNFRAMKESGFANAGEDAEHLLESARKRLRLWDIDDAQIATLEETGVARKTLTLHAPFSGVVSQKKVRDGEFVRAGRELLEISNISKVWVYASIYEYETPWVKVGQHAEVTFPFSREPIMGRISTIYPFMDKRSRTIRARIDLDNPGLNLKPDMYADIKIHTDPVAGVISIPAEAVLYTGKQETVFIDLGDGRFEPRLIEVGLQDESGYVEVNGGIEAGERVVTSAQFMLDSESKLREAIQKMLEPLPADEQEDLDDLF